VGRPVRRTDSLNNEKVPSRHWADHPLLSARRVLFLGSPMHLLTMEETLALADEAMTRKVSLHHTVVNVAKVVHMQSNAELRQDVADSDLINVDGMGVAWGARLFGIDVSERVAGIDIMERLFTRCEERGFRCFLLGAEQHILEAVRRRLQREHPRLEIAGSRDGYFRSEEEANVAEEIRLSGADCLFVAMPTPRKERFLRAHRTELGASFIMGVGGSFDVYGGKVKRAPAWIQRAGFEWLYRVLQEPRRLWKRYCDTNARYIAILLRAWLNQGV
jgi:N-acetylglucosaminyldiphosphoundecaprenol N-acetyl-beta-D-mannosaminyltransferase